MPRVTYYRPAGRSYWIRAAHWQAYTAQQERRNAQGRLVSVPMVDGIWETAGPIHCQHCEGCQ